MTSYQPQSKRGPRRRGRMSRSTGLAIGIIAGLLLLGGCIYLAIRLNAKDNPGALSGGCFGNAKEYGDLTAVVTNPDVKSVEKEYEGMKLSFNTGYHIPNWVAWELTDSETDGEVARTNKFSSDPDMEGSAESWDYNYSGYDRGHMAPAGDMKWSRKAMEETFYMTNICPQAKVLNTGAWKRLEEKCRQWAVTDGSIVIVCGPVLGKKPIEYIGDSRVYVPSKFFKVILSPNTTPMRGIGFIMPNGKPKGGMQACAVTIDSVEALTGHDFFSSLPDDIERQVESQCDFHYWSTHRTR